jgi:DNA-binding MarR family transcriptional regulator
MTQEPLATSIVDLTQAIGLLVRRLRAATASDDFSLTEAAVLGSLAKGGPLTTAELARAQAVKPQSMGTIIAALAARGLVERKPHPTDSRQVPIELTAKGADLRKRTHEAKRTWLAQAIAGLDQQDQETLFAAGDIIRRLVER